MMKNSNILTIAFVTALVFGPHQAIAENALGRAFSNAFKSALGEALTKKGPNSLASSLKSTSKKPQTEYKTEEVGVATTTANVRSRPSKNGDKVGILGEGKEAKIIGAQGNWSNIEFEYDGSEISGWIYTPLLSIEKKRVATSIGASTSKSSGKSSKSKQNIEYAGYSREFLNVKSLMSSGDPAGAEKYFVQKEKELKKKAEANNVKINTGTIENVGFLGWIERGTIGLDAGSLEKSINSFDNAETILKTRQNKSKVSSFLGSAGSFLAETVSGNEEIGEYGGTGYERVLMLNYKSIGYLLNGERKAYNVARRAIDWQDQEKKKFEEDQRKAKKKLENEKQNSNINVSSQYNDWQHNYKKLDRIAEKVPSAYVNPFGYYVTGMVQEFESKDDASLRENARIAYEKGLALNPGSDVMKQAAEDMKKPYDTNKRLVHVVVGEGFVPEKKMLVYNIPTRDGLVPIKLSIYEPVSSKVHRVEVHNSTGKKLATLSTVADVEALCLRHQKDQEGVRALRVGLSIARAVGVNQVASRMGGFGAILSGAFNGLSAPDMRSWMSLPANLRAARLKVSKKLSKIKIVSYDKNGKKLSSKAVKLNKDSDNFVYARSIDKQLYVNTSKQLWL